MIKFNLYFTTSKLVGFLILVWLFIISIALILIDKPELIIGISGIAIGAITAIFSVKNMSKEKKSEIINN